MDMQIADDQSKVTIFETRFLWPNFSGAPEKFNQTPKPNASIEIDPRFVPALEKMGFRIRNLPPKDEFEDDRGLYVLGVKASYGGYADPKVILLVADPEKPPTEWAHRKLKAEDIGELDRLTVSYVDVTFRPYHYRTFVTAYIESMYVVINPDRLMLKYGV
jgi:hypothetical protein